jgi:hypothetical protein
MDGRVGGALVQAAEEQGTPPQSATPAEEAAVIDLLSEGIERDAARGQARRLSRGAA